MNMHSNIELKPLLNGSFVMRTLRPRVTPIRVRTDIVASEQADLRRIARARLLRFKSRSQ